MSFFSLKPTIQRQKVAEKDASSKKNKQSSLCVYYATIAWFVLKPRLPQLTIVSL